MEGRLGEIGTAAGPVHCVIFPDGTHVAVERTNQPAVECVFDAFCMRYPEAPFGTEQIGELWDVKAVVEDGHLQLV